MPLLDYSTAQVILYIKEREMSIYFKKIFQKVFQKWSDSPLLLLAVDG